MYKMYLNEMNCSVMPCNPIQVSIQVRGVTFNWYQNYDLVDSRTNIASESLTIHAIYINCDSVMFPNS